MCVLDPSLVSQLQDVALLNEVAGSQRHCSSSDDDAMRGSANQGFPQGHPVALRYQASGDPQQPSPHWSCFGWLDDIARHLCYARKVDTKTL